MPTPADGKGSACQEQQGFFAALWWATSRSSGAFFGKLHPGPPVPFAACWPPCAVLWPSICRALPKRLSTGFRKQR